jgi:anionic cell wall polymer biosynthesis LytR-Cps2A-Psr (LCP) family protein
MKKLFVSLGAILVFSIIVTIVYSVYFVKSSVSKIIVPDIHKQAEPVDAMERHFIDKTPFNLLLIGYGGGTHDGANLTDSIMVVHLDPKNRTTTLISVPRDSWTKIPSDNGAGLHSKINYAYQVGLDDQDFPNKPTEFTGTSGGGNMVKSVVGNVVGLTLDNYIGMDFSGFRQTIDSLGGVDINVNPAFDDYQYPIEGKEDDTCGHTQDEIASLSAQLASPSANVSELDAFPCRYEHLHFDAGKQHMDGTTALKYVRSRHSLQDGTDFGRAKRQRNLITAVKQKVFSVGLIPHILPFMSSLKDDLRTDLSLNDIQDLIKHAQEINGYSVHTLALTDQNFLEDAVSSDGQDILQPKAGLDNWNQVHSWVQQQINPNYVIKDPTIQVENGTTTVGLADTATTKLQSTGLQILPSQNADSHEYKKTVIQTFGKISPAAMQKIETIVGSSSIQPSSADSQGQYDVLIILGSDFLGTTSKQTKTVN